MKNRLSIGILATLFIFGVLGTQAQFRITDMRVEHMHNPAVVDAQVPRMSWVNEAVKPDARGERQSAYQVVVASSRENLSKGNFDVWDSGKCRSAESSLVSYGGPELEDATDYYWQVRTWNQKGRRSEWSPIGTWRMGIKDQNWTARWIAAEGEDGMDALLMRRSFVPNQKPVNAKVFVCGLGFFEMYLNGQRVGDDYLVPNISNYTQRHDLQNFAIKLDNDFAAYRCLYMAYDVTDLLREGENMLGVMLGCGWYHPEPGRASIFGGKCLRLQLLLTYADGTHSVVETDGSWQTHPSPIAYSGVYGGELYDAREEVTDWAAPGNTDNGWTPAQVIDGPMGQMTAMTSPSDKVTERLKPVSLRQTGQKEYEVDFGKEIAGWIHFTGLNGQRGDTLQVDFVCESPQGNNRYVLKGSGSEEYRPHFTWFAFSKAKIRGVAGLTAENITAEAVNTDVPLSAEFSCSNPLLNRINQIWQRSQMDNMHGCIASDCPHREKLPYTGDGQAASETVMHNFDAAPFYQKWIRDMRDSQNRHTGHVPNSAPWQPGAGGGVGWGAAMGLMPWWFYEQYGDRRMLEDSYQSMKDQVRYMMTWLTPEGIMNQKMKNHGTEDVCYWLNLGDWVPPKEMPRDELVHTFYLWQCLDYCARTARVLGEEEDAAHYRAKAEEVASCFHRQFYNREAKSYGLAGSNIYALKMGVPEADRADVIATLRKEIMEDNRGCINTGFLGAKYFFETLADAGLNDVAYAVISGKEQPSFGWWIEQGATVTWEQWDGANSHNHPMFGGGLTWLYRRLAGVMTDEAHPGYRHIVIRPMLTEMEEVRYARQTPYGQLVSQIHQHEGIQEVSVEIPVGSTATLHLPTTERITEHGKPAEKSKGVTHVATSNGETVLELQQGKYHFQWH